MGSRGEITVKVVMVGRVEVRCKDDVEDPVLKYGLDKPFEGPLTEEDQRETGVADCRW